jgi:mono/diheme cytochrome c family protein
MAPRLPFPLVLAPLFVSLAAAQAPGPAGAGGIADAGELFAKNCASCHGETGDGRGTTKLDRPARSFRDGGFSYGNTPDALFRTITYGIPGTPMPAFESSLSVAEREALAAHVVSLGPPIEAVDPERTVIRVGARPVIVRGYLPPISAAATGHPRGLLIGRPEGMTFEYRVDDVRLLGLRQGAFVERRDWTGRGGAALAPLGGVVQLVEGGEPAAPFAARDGVPIPLKARLAGSFVEGSEAGLEYRLERDGETLAYVREAPRPAGTSVGAGFARAFRIVADRDVELVQRLFAAGDAERVDSLRTAGAHPREWTVWRRRDGMHDVVGVELVADGRSYALRHGAYVLELAIAAGDEVRADVTVLTAYEWNDATRARFTAEVTR